MAEEDLTRLQLDVYDTRDGPWNPEHGALTIPEGWAFLPSGDAYLTRTVKAAGVFWLAWRPRGKNRPHRRKLGLWAPVEAIEQAGAAADQSTSQRARGRQQGARQRARAEDRYRVELAAAIVDFLAFHPVHHELAVEIAAGAAAQAAAVGSGRVGRTRTLPLEERAGLAARAWVRHRYTDYEGGLDTMYGDDVLLDELTYRAVKSAANQAVDDFIAASSRHTAPKRLPVQPRPSRAQVLGRAPTERTHPPECGRPAHPGYAGDNPDRPTYAELRIGANSAIMAPCLACRSRTCLTRST